ncbi:ER membrane protein complex subunit 2 [Halyomorpha halys]|uniref:ER membrane protein complex subunit 2 n=1 Tax=Halyomorpha halys TaxID=286706 RepID=UPI0006D52744|nr:ER membrane protein complex subunit 2-like [Halyomorpha halys]
MHWSEARDIIRKWREENARKSQELIELWEEVLKPKAYKLGDEYYLVLEQVCIAAFDCNRLDVANDSLQVLSSKFPGSVRIALLQVLHLEALERYDDALNLLDSIIKRDETNAAPRKRRVAILKAQGKIVEAIKDLSDYLKIFMVDQEAWQELCELYLCEQEYGKAAFCMEELLLHNPHNHLFHQRLAEIKYTQGGFENMDTARLYFCQSYKLNPKNIRSLYGIFLSSANVAASQKCTSSKKKEANQLSVWALKQINERYRDARGKNDEALDSLESNLGLLHLNSTTS